MKRFTCVSSAVFVALASAAALLACASDETNPNDGAPDDGSKLPADGGSADAPSEAADASDPCLPGMLCPGGPYTATGAGLPLDRRARINVIRGRSPSDVWVGGAHATIAHWDGQTWSRSEVGGEASIRALWLRERGEIASASELMWFVRGLAPPDAGTPSAGGWIDYGRPSTAGGPERLTSGWGSATATWFWFTTLQTVDPTDGINGLWRLRVDDATDTLEIASTLPDRFCTDLGCRRMMSVHGSSDDDLWAVGTNGAAMHITAAQSDSPVVTALNSATAATLNGVWAASPSDVWAVGAGGVMRHYSGQPVSFDIVADVTAGESLNAVWGTSSSDVWAVGDASLVLHYDGKEWTRVPVGGLGGLRPDLYSVWTGEPGHVWIGGDGIVLAMEGKP